MVLSGKATATPKRRDGIVEAIRVLQIARRSAIKARTQAGQQIRSMVGTAPPELHASLTTSPSATDRTLRAIPSRVTRGRFSIDPARAAQPRSTKPGQCGACNFPVAVHFALEEILGAL